MEVGGSGGKCEAAVDVKVESVFISFTSVWYVKGEGREVIAGVMVVVVVGNGVVMSHSLQ